MNNYFGQLYLDLCEYLKTVVPELRWIDQDFGQLEHFEVRPEVSFPCCLIDFVSASYSGLSNLAQIGEVVVNIRLGFAPFSQSYHAAPMNVKEKALEFYDVEQKVYEALQGWSPVKDNDNYTQPFYRQSAMTEQRDGDRIGLRVRVLSFGTQFEDNTAKGIYRKVAKPPLQFDETQIQ
ncbi:hypothetical protein [Chryseosolibacter indicus]|uniref:Uncharacterized protein n=1 Tax=Chryseosolibacter indicus TaxID=2782351 RepID=A0ABS5VNB4_9BACT|nr:hypothetical protein [Chryseosolibacter indicus]MBT1702942.1 hypothetical protein [Chryseosolibacter indicus]